MNFKLFKFIGPLLLSIIACSQQTMDPKNQVIAKINGEPIYYLEFLSSFNQLKSEQDEISQKNPKVIETLKTRALNESIITSIVRLEATKRQISVNREQIESRLTNWKDGYPPGGFEEMLKKQNTTEEQLKRHIEDQLLVEHLIQALFANETLVSDEEVKKHHSIHEKEFIQPERIHVFQIVVPTKEEAEKIRQEIASNQISFESAARSRSMSPDASKGGDLGFFARGSKIPEFDQAFSLSVGQISKPISSRFGVHLLKVVEKDPSRKLSFNEAKTEIVKLLKHEKEVRIYKEWLAKLLKDGEIYRNDTLFNSLS